MAGESKTEKATDKKRRDERKKGNIFLSKDIITLVSLLGMFFVMKLYFSQMYAGIKKYLIDYINYTVIKNDITNDAVLNMSIDFVMTFIRIAMPLLITSCLLAI